MRKPRSPRPTDNLVFFVSGRVALTLARGVYFGESQSGIFPCNRERNMVE